MMAELLKTETFDKWLNGLRDLKAMARINVRLNRLAEGNPGDVKSVGAGISELSSTLYKICSRPRPENSVCGDFVQSFLEG